MRRVLGVSMCICVCLALQAFGQSSDARVSGTVSDPSGAVLPGVEVKATNTATGVETTSVSNGAGAYNFASLLPGTYNINASLPGFQTQTFDECSIGQCGAGSIELHASGRRSCDQC